MATPIPPLLSQNTPNNYPTSSSASLISLYFRLLSSSTSLLHLRHLHARLLRSHIFFSSSLLSSTLLLSYSRLRRLLPTSLAVFHHIPFPNSYSFNTLIAELFKSSLPHLALRFFAKMHSSHVPVDEFTLPPILRSCALIGSSTSGKMVHGMSVRLGLDRNLFVASTLVMCYAGSSEICYARQLFDELGERDAVLWTSMLSGYAQNQEPESALWFFREMVREGVLLDGVVMVSLLLACGQLGWLRHGRSVHACTVRRCPRFPLSLGNALVDMYVKCGVLGCAERVFRRMLRKDVISWSSLIVGHGLSGNVDVALKLFEEMTAERTEPNSVTFLGVLSACGHAGMVDEAGEVFDRMNKCGVKPELKHYSCMADALGRAGRLAEAERFIEEMPIEPDEAILGALLAACRVYGDVEVGERVSKRLMGMCPGKSGYYLSLANMYSDVGRFDDAERVRDFMKQTNVAKLPGRSSIESDGFQSIPNAT
ncbi:pentatricopeptide repeat-containing protein At4g14170 [Typha latifolia]|uniref:pentatricopeptide repeat-containing protein At4g14170 n=1 Tax=Typha latifolia TaxID=4733 RepID=UPI003C2D3A02